jgi:GxxExxY protein
MPPNDAFDARTYAIVGAAMEVHSTLGCGFLEKVYHLAMENEFRRRGIPFESEVLLPISYKGDVLPCTYRVDLLCYGEVIVELKALQAVGGVELAQVLNYLKAGTCDVGLLLNFGVRRLEARRVAVFDRGASSVSSVESVDGT